MPPLMQWALGRPFDTLERKGIQLGLQPQFQGEDMGQDERQDERKGSGEKSPIEKLTDLVEDFIDGVLDDLKALVNPPRPVRVPVTAIGPRRPR